MLLLSFILLLIFQYSCSEISNATFPDGFVFGVATASYQIEGAWNEDGKRENIWDHDLHENPALITDQSNGDIAADSYHKYKEDVQLIKDLGADFYRFSISWSRLIPGAIDGSELNEKGVAYYNNLIDELLANGIEPYVTMFHWDTPQILEDQGGWLNETIVDNFVYYARQLYTLYGDRVKKWITFNEPKQICEAGYASAGKAPFLTLQGTGDYLCYHHCALAHGKTYRLYENEFKSIQQGEVGITVDTFFAEPKTNSSSDQEAAEQYMQFNYGWFVHPILLGNYPPIMIERIDYLSEQEGRNVSRLPKFTEDEIEMIKGTFDFLGLNHYTSVLTTFGDPDSFPNPSHSRDCGVETSIDPSWKASSATWLFSAPESFRHLLVWIKDHYDNPTVIVTENGWAGPAEPDLNDTDRMEYYTKYLSELLKAVYEDGCNIVGYTAWSLIDNFEWTFGYTNRFGITYVDFDDPERPRTPRASYTMFKNIISTRRLNTD